MTKSPNTEEYEGIRNNTKIKENIDNNEYNKLEDNYRKESERTNNSLLHKNSILGKLF